MGMPDQERLSEQASFKEEINRRVMAAGERWTAVADEHLAELARQLTEAERRDGACLRLMDALDHDAVFMTYDPMNSDEKNDELQRRYRRVRKALDDARAALDTADSPESAPKSSSGEALDTGGSEG